MEIQISKIEYILSSIDIKTHDEKGCILLPSEREIIMRGYKVEAYIRQYTKVVIEIESRKELTIDEIKKKIEDRILDPAVITVGNTDTKDDGVNTEEGIEKQVHTLSQLIGYLLERVAILEKHNGL